jgi:hypothetical protein
MLFDLVVVVDSYLMCFLGGKKICGREGKQLKGMKLKKVNFFLTNHRGSMSQHQEGKVRSWGLFCHIICHLSGDSPFLGMC